MRIRPILLSAIAVLGLLVGAWWWQRASDGREARLPRSLGGVRADAGVPVASRAGPDSGADLAAEADQARLAARLAQLFRRSGVRPDEGVLTFATEAAYREFLARAGDAGVAVLARIEGLRAVRVRVDDYDAFAGALRGRGGDFEAIGANPVMQPPAPPPAEERSSSGQTPVLGGLLSALGFEAADNSAWGQGVLIAILDSGVLGDATFGDNRVKTLDVGQGFTGADSAHGTAVAAIAAGGDASARGVAPAADILSIRVTDTNGQSDLFTVAQAIMAAAEAGAEVINVSLGGYATARLLEQAIDQAQAAGAVVVASAGNDQAGQLAWPAAYPQVISVGATDAAGWQMAFSNSGEQLRLTAPGYAITTAAGGGDRIYFSGTSASAPVVSGAIAALLSTNPSLTAAEAAQVLQTHANDGGTAGPDASYGSGVVNLVWAMDRDNASRVDGAVSAWVFDAKAGTVEVVVQNRGAQPLSGASLAVTVDGAPLLYPLLPLEPGASTSVKVPVVSERLEVNGKIVFRAELAMPAGTLDQAPKNNRAAAELAK
ncbi:subtilisin-like serine protease [Opitutaceae bacterium TAV1]|nr:subtilisin-like serine protease [Opitutaceae bacterium TAV1]